jgi:hypothetical protein
MHSTASLFFTPFVAALHRPMPPQVSNPSSEQQLEKIWTSFAVASNTRSHITTPFPSKEFSHNLLMPQTCFCCVLETQRDESSVALQDGRRDDVAAEMLRVLSRPFMVRSQHVLLYL